MSEVGVFVTYSIYTRRQHHQHFSLPPLQKEMNLASQEQDLLLWFTMIPAWLKIRAHSLRNECAGQLTPISHGVTMHPE